MNNTRETVQGLVDHFCQQEGIKQYQYEIQYDSKLARVAACRKVFRHFDSGKYVPERSSFIFFFSEKFLAHLSREELVDTVIHEIAHALTDPREKPHGAVWRRNAQRMGGTGETLHMSTERQNEAMKKYRGSCQKGHTYYRNRKSPNETYYCPTCSPTVNGRKHYISEAAIKWVTLR